MRRNFNELIGEMWDQGRFVCVGLDSDDGKIPAVVVQSCMSDGISGVGNHIATFNRAIVNTTKEIAGYYKPNFAFYIRHGVKGLIALHQSIMYINTVAPDIPVILDCKDADIDNTNIGYVQMAFDYCGADAITINPYLGMDAVQPFLDQKDKGIIVLCRTSNKGSGEFQDLRVNLVAQDPAAKRNEFARFANRIGQEPDEGSVPLYQYVAFRVAEHWNKNGNCGVVVGATYPGELKAVREIIGDLPILIPGIGAQGGDVEATVKAGKSKDGKGMIINASRGIIFASKGEDYAQAAHNETLKLHNSINQCLNQ